MQRVSVYATSERGEHVLYTNVDGTPRGAIFNSETVCSRCGNRPTAGQRFIAFPRPDFTIATWEHDGDCPKGT